jgi:hypothetical protein
MDEVMTPGPSRTSRKGVTGKFSIASSGLRGLEAEPRFARTPLRERARTA